MNSILRKLAISSLVITLPASVIVAEESLRYDYAKARQSLEDLFDEARKNIRHVDELLEAEEVRKRNQAREAAARQALKDGNALREKGDLEGARTAWEKALRITEDPEMEAYIEKQEQLAEDEEKMRRQIAREQEKARKVKLDNLYDNAKQLYENDRFVESLEVFGQVLEMEPEYRSARKYVDMKIPQRQARQAKRIAEEKAAEEAERKARAIMESRAEKARELYEQGNRLFSGGDLQGAKTAWQEALQLTDDEEMKLYIHEQEKLARKQEKTSEVHVGVQEQDDSVQGTARGVYAQVDAPVDHEKGPDKPRQPAPGAAIKGGSASRSMFTLGVEAREPLESSTTFTTADKRVFYFTEFTGIKGEKVSHVWEHDGQEVVRVNLGEVRGNRWRTWSAKYLTPLMTGTWTVSAVGEDGTVFVSESFRYVAE